MSHDKYLIEKNIPNTGIELPILNSWDPNPLYSEITYGLYQGGTPNNERLRVGGTGSDSTVGFDAVITMYYDVAPANRSIPELRFLFKDGKISEIDLDELRHTIIWGRRHLLADHKLLVRCQAGLNRSGLIAALLLMLDGHAVEEAITLLREKRSEWALCNDEYVTWLFEHGEKFIKGII